MCGGFPGCCCNNCNFNDHFDNGKVNCRFKHFTIFNPAGNEIRCNTQYTEAGTKLSRPYYEDLPGYSANPRIFPYEYIGLCFKYPTWETWRMKFKVVLANTFNPRNVLTVEAHATNQEELDGDFLRIDVAFDFFRANIRNNVFGDAPNQYVARIAHGATFEADSLRCYDPIDMVTELEATADDVLEYTIEKRGPDSYFNEWRINNVVPFVSPLIWPGNNYAAQTFSMTGRTSRLQDHGRMFITSAVRELNLMSITCEELLIPDPEPE